MCFFFGGLRYHEQTFNNTAASTMASLMAVASASLVIPAALYQTLITPPKEPSFDSVLKLSHYTAIVLLILYIMYIYFQFYSHHDLFQCEDDSEGEHPTVLSRNQAAVVLCLATIVVSFCADNLVGAIDDIVVASGLSKTFIGLILIPIVGNAAEHVSSVVVAMENKVRTILLLRN